MKKLALILSLVAVVTLAGVYFTSFAKKTQASSGSDPVKSQSSYGYIFDHEAHHR